MTEPSDPALLQRWNSTLRAARTGHEGPDPSPYGRNLLARWAEPQRRYHTVDHLRAVLDRIDELADQGGEGGELELVRLAAWFHDAVYRPERSENEERSAVLAEKALTEAGLTPHEVAEVARLVRLTITHDPAEGDVNGEVLCDADLAILATDEDTYGGMCGRSARSTTSSRRTRSARAARRSWANSSPCPACSAPLTARRPGNRGPAGTWNGSWRASGPDGRRPTPRTTFRSLMSHTRRGARCAWCF